MISTKCANKDHYLCSGSCDPFRAVCQCSCHGRGGDSVDDSCDDDGDGD